jgi:IPT/TIG domain
MPNPPQPPPGHMVLSDDILSPLEDNTYRITVETDVTIDGAPAPVDPNADPLSKQSYFTIQGPRFQLAQTEVVGVFPPRNGHGSFSDNVPHIVLSRRTLPWERPLDPANRIPAPTQQQGAAPLPAAPPPWLALLLFEDGDNFKIVQNMPLEQIVGPQIYQDLGSPPNVNCDALVTDELTLDSILPTVEELTLLAHVRQVNVNDRELNIGSSDGFFAVVMSNRLPSPNANCTACLVSLEARSDVCTTTSSGAGGQLRQALTAPQDVLSFPSPVNFPAPVEIGGVGKIGYINPIIYTLRSVQLVLLQSWKFSVTGSGSFRDLMQELNVAMFGTVANPGHPPLTDSGHLPMDLQDRAGEPEEVFYRGPLTPFQLTRDPLGPYHSADQCLRANPETGGKDISYAAAFEVGRLLAASDKTLATALAQWRRDAYSQSSRADTLGRAVTALGIQPIDLHAPAVPFLASGAATLAAQGAGPIADPFGLDKVQTAIGFNPAAVQTAFNLDTQQQAIAILGGDAGATGAAVAPIVQTARNATTIDEVAADSLALSRLVQARNQGIANTAVQLGLPIVNSISPNSGPSTGGTAVTISGSRFTGASAANFGPAAGLNFAVVSDTQITVVSPSQDAAGQNAVDVTVINAAGASAVTAADVFTYVSPPQVTAINPTSGPLGGGTNVTITGSGFTGATAVDFGTVAGTGVTVVSDTQITVVSPPVSPTGQTIVDVIVVTPVGTSEVGTTVDKFSYVQPPAVTGIRPPAGPAAGGTTVSIIGSGFLTATGVEFGSIPAQNFESNGDQLIIAVSPAGQNGTQVDITVTNPAGTSAAVATDKFTYLDQPVVLAVEPNSGGAAGGATVAIFGSGFTNATSVNFGSAAAKVLNVTDGEITVITPPGLGVVEVTVTNPVGTSAATAQSQYTYTLPRPPGPPRPPIPPIRPTPPIPVVKSKTKRAVKSKTKSAAKSKTKPAVKSEKGKKK